MSRANDISGHPGSVEPDFTAFDLADGDRPPSFEDLFGDLLATH